MGRTIDTRTEDLLARVEGSVGVITFNRPERRNALSEGIYRGFTAALPEISLPLHQSSDGLPTGIQLVAQHGREDLLLSIAAQQHTDWSSRKPPISA
jgi:hypothetical protein